VYGKFTAEPLKRDMDEHWAIPCGRVISLPLEGAALSSVKIEGAPHEFCSLPGVVEDVTDPVLNLKGVLLKMSSVNKMLELRPRDRAKLRRGAIETDGTIECSNPDFHIATLADDGKLDMELEVRVGRGFCPAEWNKKEEQEIGRIPSIRSSPVSRVNFAIENTRVGQRTD